MLTTSMVPLKAPRTPCPLPCHGQSAQLHEVQATYAQRTRPVVRVWSPYNCLDTCFAHRYPGTASNCARCRTLPAPLPVLLPPSPTSGWLWSKGSLGSSPSYQPCTAAASIGSVRGDRPQGQLLTVRVRACSVRIPFPCLIITICLQSQKLTAVRVCLLSIPQPNSNAFCTCAPVYRHTGLIMPQPLALEPLPTHSEYLSYP